VIPQSLPHLPIRLSTVSGMAQIRYDPLLILLSFRISWRRGFLYAWILLSSAVWARPGTTGTGERPIQAPPGGVGHADNRDDAWHNKVAAQSAAHRLLLIHEPRHRNPPFVLCVAEPHPSQVLQATRPVRLARCSLPLACGGSDAGCPTKVRLKP